MSSDIITCLQLDNDCEVYSKVFVVKELNGCDSSFVVSCVLGHWIKKQKPVLLISTHNSRYHYQNVGLKMNYNLQRHIASGLVQFFDIGDEYLNQTLNNSLSIEQIFDNLKKTITSMQEKHGHVNIILDGVSHLFDMECTLREVNHFCTDIIRLLRKVDNSYLLCHCNVASEDDVTHVMANMLAWKAYTVLELESLPSGWSADVSGHLTVTHPGRRFEVQDLCPLEIKPTLYLFKLFDRGVKLLAPGTV